jgi:hypothetical protein
LSKVTLDIIGLAGFGYAFDALSRPDGDPDELSAAFDAMFSIGARITVWNVLQSFFPFLFHVVCDTVLGDEERNLCFLSSRRKTI